MPPFTKLDNRIVSLLCCPMCKSALKDKSFQYICTDCGSIYPLVDTQGGRVYDFRFHHPSYLSPKSKNKWFAIQRIWENYNENFAKRDNFQEYLDEIESVKEIYTTEFEMSGNILDIGGFQGRLRHYLHDSEVPIYLSVDPFLDSFHYANNPNLLKAYPCLSKPCNFLSCYAESLPIISNCFDWVHMRSVVDHLIDPYIAFKEAFRVLKPSGQLLIGLSIDERMISSYSSIIKQIYQKYESGGVLFTLKTVFDKLFHVLQPAHDDHNFRLSHHELLDLISITEFNVVKEHWQKPPYSYVIYISARKKTLE